MRRMSYLITTALFAAAHASAAQQLPATVETAEAEGATFPRLAAPTAFSFAFARTFGGMKERKCVPPPSSDDSIPGGSLRSGDVIIRARLTGEWGLRANRDHKILWLPLHNPGEYRDTLLIRAVRIGHRADSLRQSISAWAWSGSKTDSGFPSIVRCPAAGTWLVVATAGGDWGCFLLPVAA
jgi:hypothetical protein